MANRPHQGLILRRIYRSLLRAAKPFTTPSPNSVVLSCLLHRTGLGDGHYRTMHEADMGRARNNTSRSGEKEMGEVEDEESDDSDDDEGLPLHQVLFRKLLREVISGSQYGIRQMQFPAQIRGEVNRGGDPKILKSIIRREFLNKEGCISCSQDISIRRELAFSALRELNTKLAWYDKLQRRAATFYQNRPQSMGVCRAVNPLPLESGSSSLRRGVYLLAHPHLTGYFRRSVICVLDHAQDPGKGSRSYGQTYGIIVNRVGTSSATGKRLTLEEVVRPLPSELAAAFGTCVVKEGGPVHMSIQMLHSSSSATREGEGKASAQLGGCALPFDSDNHLNSQDKAVSFGGDVMRAAEGVISGRLNREDICFFVGASCWAGGQLENEIERGCWLVCSGPPLIAMTGMCELQHQDHSEETVLGGASNPTKDDLWLSMMSACGREEADLAHLFVDHLFDEDEEGSQPCDDFS